MSDRTAPDARDKFGLRTAMRALRRSIPDHERRSHELWQSVIGLPVMATADTVLAFTSLPGEPETQELMVWCAATGRHVAVPESDVGHGWPDVVVVPGLAFTAAGDRLGQGGGWYDRFLAEAHTAASIGVCFAEQVVEALPVELHDVTMDHVVTDRGVLR